jgi:hypothetical protein
VKIAIVFSPYILYIKERGKKRAHNIKKAKKETTRFGWSLDISYG